MWGESLDRRRHYTAPVKGCDRLAIGSRDRAGVLAGSHPGRAASSTLDEPPVMPSNSETPASSPRPAPDGETTLVSRLLAGDEAAFSSLVSRYHASMVGVARRFGCDPGVAEEVAQETWLAVLEGLLRFEGRSALTTWIFGILVNRAKTRAARESRIAQFAHVGETAGNGEPAPDDERFTAQGRWAAPPRPWNATPEALLLRAEVRSLVERALVELPPVQQAVVRLRDVEGFSPPEVCNILEISETNQRVLLHRGRAKIRRALEGALGDADHVVLP